MNDQNHDAHEDSDTNRDHPPFDDFVRSLGEACRKGGRDAREAIDEQMPKAKEDFAKGIHDVAYAVSYACAFGTALLREFAPDPLADGVREGKEAGHRAADEVVRNRREREEHRKREEHHPGDDPGPVPV